MYGAIVGDLAGSIYEFDQTKGIYNPNKKILLEDQSFYSDDTILTIAIADAILSGGNYEDYLRKYINEYKDYKPDFKPYFKSSFSPGLIKWSNGNYIGNSTGNGAMMRVSPIGYLFNSEEEVINNAYLSCLPSHNSKEATECSIIIALIIYYFRQGLSKEEVFKKLKLNPIYKPFERFNRTCYETINNCLYILYNSKDFNSSIINAVNMGGDTDTNACIVGSMAEALYGIDDELISQVDSKLPNEFVRTLKKIYK